MKNFLFKLSGQAENQLYGHLSILARYCGLEKAHWLNGYLQHGWNGCDGFSNYAGSKRLAKKYIWSKRALRDLIARDGKNVEVIGSPWLYNLRLKNILDPTPKNLSEKVIAYPLHSQPWAPKDYLHSEYSKFLKENYGEITISLHWTEFSNKEVILAYKSLGHSPITYGVGSPWLEGFNNKILENQINTLTNYGKMVTNAMQTSVLYALSLGLKIEFGGPASWTKKADEFGTYGEYGQDYWKEQILNNPEKTWKTELGFDELQTPQQLLKTLDWESNRNINFSFMINRLLDVIRDEKLSEKKSYLVKGKN